MANTKRLLQRWLAVSALSLVLVAGGYGVASAASGKGTKAASTTKTTTQRTDETPLTGDTLAKATAAALAKVPGGKVVRAETEADGNAAYEVHMTDAAGAPVTVYLDKDFSVVGVDTRARGGGRHGGRGHHGGGQRSDETPLTGDALSKASAAALAKVPGGK